MESPSGTVKVKQLVQRFEEWEKKESEKKRGAKIAIDGNDLNLPPVTPRGQVRRLRDQLEAKTRLHESATVIPAKKNEKLKRLETSYYETKDDVNSGQDDENSAQDPYVHVEAYWDQATEAYWYQNENGDWLVYDELTKAFVDPTDVSSRLNLPEKVAMNVNQPVSSPVRESCLMQSSAAFGVFGGLDTKKRVENSSSKSPIGIPNTSSPKAVIESNTVSTSEVHQSHASKSIDQTSPRNDELEDELDSSPAVAPLDEEQDEKISIATLSMLHTALADVSARVNVPIQTLRKFHLGVQLYALVKGNGGMLKPIIIHLAVDRGKIYIVRQGRSRFLTIRHFSECDYSSSCIDFMAKDSSKTSSGMKQTIQGLRQQPLVVLWTSPHFSKRSAESTAANSADGNSKGMAFVFDNRNLRSEFITVLRAMVDQWLTPNDIPFTFKEKENDEKDISKVPSQEFLN